MISKNGNVQELNFVAAVEEAELALLLHNTSLRLARNNFSEAAFYCLMALDTFNEARAAKNDPHIVEVQNRFSRHAGCQKKPTPHRHNQNHTGRTEQ